MHTATKLFWAAVLTVLAGIPALAAGSPAQTLNLPANAANYTLDDDEEPEVKARVARISFLSGEAKIRRSGVEEWEKATLNLPLVEGDELTTDRDTRLEIQFDKNQHLRLAENAYLKIVTLKDAGIAVGLSLGTMTVRIRSFDKVRAFFEIDAPKTTIAIQRAGSYRVDAGRTGDGEIRVAARDGGEARVYSNSSGFTLKSGRSSRIFIDGQNVGEWETGDAAKYGDAFDDWSAERDSTIAKRLSVAYYDKYYDSDIYGADDLNDNGEWVYVNTYGYVWRPYQTTIVRYADWSPYRYGNWRWMPPYGWIWVNDEPWGWATYHHGRWFYNAGYWCWSPYGYYRPSRSWWFPALVAINIISNNTCWYPLSYHHHWHNYNGHNNGHPHNGGPQGNGNGVAVNGARGPRNLGNGVAVNGARDPRGLNGSKKDPVDFGDNSIPPGGIVTINRDQFGTGAKPDRRPPTLSIAKEILSKKPGDGDETELPTYKDINGRITRDIRAEKPRGIETVNVSGVGAAVRKPDAPLDNDLRNQTVFGGRPPRPDVVNGSGVQTEPRKPGVFQRPPARQDNEVVERITPPTPRDKPRVEPPVDDRPRLDPPVRRDPPKEIPRSERPRDEPRYTPPPRSEPPTVRPPRSEPPPKSEPKPEGKAPPPAKADSGKREKPGNL